MIIVKLISGLGNQLFQYALGRRLSLQKGVPLMLDTSFYRHQELRTFTLDHYNINAAVASDAGVDRLLHLYRPGSLQGRIFRKIKKYLPVTMQPYYKEKEWWVFEPGVFKVPADAYLDGYWQHCKYLEGIDGRVLEELTVKETPSGAYQKLFSDIQATGTSVSLHIRRGDLLTDLESQRRMGIMPMDYYIDAVRIIREKVGDPAFFVFSDDIPWAAANLHLDAPVTFVDAQNETKDYMELDAMSRCTHNIIANSSFSWWGAFLNRNPGKIVVAPRKWVADEESNRKIHLQLPSWIQL